MPSPESFPSGGEPIEEKAPVTPAENAEIATDESEVIGEKERKTYEERGEKTLEADKAKAAEKSTRMELEKEREKLQEEIRMLEMRRDLLIKYGAKPKAERVDDDKPAEEAPEEKPETKATPIIAVAPEDKPAESGEIKESGAEDEPATPEEIKEVKKRAKKSSGARKWAAGVCALIAFAGIGLGILGAAKNNKGSDRNTNGTPAIVTVANEAGERMKGIYDGYGEKGMYLSEHKTSAVAFADAGEVSEVCDDDEVDMILYTAHNQVESFADYLANIPQELQPDGFKGLSITETEAKLESLSPEDFTALEGTFATIMNNALTRRVTLNGRYDNAYMRVKNPGQDIVHENMELVRCTTNEHNLEVTQFYWTDASGRELGTMTVKMTPVRDEKGAIESFKGCEQVVNPEGSSTIYTGMPEIPTPEPTPPTPTPPTPEPEPEPEPTPELTPKDPQQEIEHAGPDVTPLELDEDVTPPTTLEQDQANFDAIEQQRQEDAARQAEADRVAAEQAAAEQQAAVQAEARRQAEAEAAAQRSAEEAAAEAARQAEANRAAEAAAQAAAQEQAARAAAEQQAAQEATAREQAQAEANAAAAQAAAQAEQQHVQEQQASDAGQSMSDFNANLFENGDF